MKEEQSTIRFSFPLVCCGAANESKKEGEQFRELLAPVESLFIHGISSSVHRLGSRDLLSSDTGWNRNRQLWVVPAVEGQSKS